VVGLANYRALFADPLVRDGRQDDPQVPRVRGRADDLPLARARDADQFPASASSASFAALYLIPAAVSFAASALIWQFIFRPGNQGLLDYLLSLVGITGPNWLSSTTWAIPALDIITIWLALPTATVLYLAGALQRIPDVLIEAAMLDGAGPVRRLRYIIWPGVRYMTVLCRDRRPACFHQRIVRSREHPDARPADLRDADAHLLHLLLHGVHPTGSSVMPLPCRCSRSR